MELAEPKATHFIHLRGWWHESVERHNVFGWDCQVDAPRSRSAFSYL